ncbi:ABC transporter substrate-binding protein [Paenibacillus sp. PL2-23]|uniref:ABC transporter substrate-binding protein n=1 Tax=Paenibacillus sp. PL2-23 TaxID=2100729 RepID=UPI0030FA5568
MYKWKMASLKVFVVALALVIAGCSGGASSNNNATPSASTNTEGTATTEPVETLDPVELTWYFINFELQTDYESVQKAINDYLQPKINTTIKFMPVLAGDYTDKMNAVAASGEAYDLAWTSNWNFHYADNISKGAFLELDSLLETHGKEFYESMPEKVWEDIRENGKLYAVPNYQIAAKRSGLIIQKEYADKYNLDTSNLRTLADIEPFLEQIKQNEPDNIIPYGTQGSDFELLFYGLTNLDPALVRENGGKLVLENRFASPEYMDYAKLIRSWNQKGYISLDAATLKLAEQTQTGNVVVVFDNTLKPGGEPESAQRFGGKEVIYVPMTDAQYTGVRPTLTAISKTSKNPERAMMFLNLLNTDSELYNMVAYGLEGKHYEKLNDNTIRPIPNGGYNPGVSWVYGNELIGHLIEGKPADTIERTIEMNNSAELAPTFGFSFDNSEVQAENANIKAVKTEYATAINTGMVDPEEYIPRFLDALNRAGIDKYIAEMQEQFDAFLASRK